jgi:quinohemoprotein ethanol dehydrogenase
MVAQLDCSHRIRPEPPPYERGNAGRVIALHLDGGVVPKPPRVLDASFPRPPPREGSAAQIDQGAILYNRFCSRCHTFERGELPDLQRVAAVPQVAFDRIVLGGALAAQGMGRFSDVF